MTPMTPIDPIPIVDLVNISRTYTQRGKPVKAVDRVTLSVQKGDVLCLVGESGCGKTTTGKMVAGLVEPSGGHILYDGKDIQKLTPTEFREYRMAVQIIHQDPYASLNPTHTIEQIDVYKRQDNTRAAHSPAILAPITIA